MSKDSDFVAQKAREAFLKIRELRKTMPQLTRAQKDALEKAIQEVQDRWWEEVKSYMGRDKNTPPFSGE